MSSPSSVWQRIGNLFRGGAGRTDGNGAGDAPLPEGSVAEGGARQALARWGRREPSVAQMRDGYQRMLELMDAMQEHFRRQDEREAQLGESAERMVGILEQLGTTGQAQQEHLRSMADHVREAGKHTALISESLSQVPRSLQLQAEAARTMLRQMEISQEADTQLMHSLQQLSRSVDSLGTSSAAQVQTLERLDQAEREQRQALTLLVREQMRRFVLITIVVAAVGLAALAMIVFVLLRATG